MSKRLKSGVQLITYVDRLGKGPLPLLTDMFATEMAGLFDGIHLLPFYWPIDGADAGYDPVDHTRVDPRLGSWADVKHLASKTVVMADLIANHISSKSTEFLHYADNGSKSPFGPMFELAHRLYPNGPDADDIARVAHPGGTTPLHIQTLNTGEDTLLWSSFSKDQIDIDVETEIGWNYLMSVLDHLKDAGVDTVRLDAVGYTIKTPGTSCFMTDETLAFIERLCAAVRKRSMQSVLEIHGHPRHMISGAAVADLVYDFCLPPLVLHTLFTADAGPLKCWLDQSPHNVLTVLDTHDGIGVMDVAADPDNASHAGLLSDTEIQNLIATLHSNSGGNSEKASGAAAENLDISQINCTFYDALARDGQAYLIARLIQFFAPGIPQVYYAGWLAAENDMSLLEATGVGRDVNRPYYSRQDVAIARNRPVVVALEALIRFRNTNPGFGPEFNCTLYEPAHFALTRRNGKHWVRVDLDLSAMSYAIDWGDGETTQSVHSVLDLPASV